jgi:hypothetical protein
LNVLPFPRLAAAARVTVVVRTTLDVNSDLPRVRTCGEDRLATVGENSGMTPAWQTWGGLLPWIGWCAGAHNLRDRASGGLVLDARSEQADLRSRR